MLLPESDLRIEKTLASLDWTGVGLATVVANRLWLFVSLGLDSTAVGITVKDLSGSPMSIGLARMEHADKPKPNTKRVWRIGHRKMGVTSRSPARRAAPAITAKRIILSRRPLRGAELK